MECALKSSVLLIALSVTTLSCRMRNSELLETKAKDLPQSLDDKVDVLTGVKDAIPPLFKEATTYMVDMLALIDEQRELLIELEANTKYRKQMELRLARGRALGLDVSVASGTDKVVQRRIDPQAISSWARKMVDTLELIAAQNKNGQPMGLAIARFASQNLPLALGFSSLMTGCILGSKNLSKEQRSELLKLSPQNKAKRILEAGGTWDLSGFDLKRFPGVTSVAELPELIRRSSEAYERTTLAMQTHVLLQNDQGVIDERMDTLKARLVAVSEGDLDLFVDKAAFEMRFGRLVALVSLPNASEAQKLIGQSVRDISQTTITEQIRVEGVRLEEAEHRLAMFRGMASGDCSTEHSAGYSALPNEYVFLVYDTKGRVLGYAAATIVNDAQSKKPMLYVHTIAGKRLQASHALGVFEGLRQLVTKFELAGMLLPVKTAIAGLNNFAAPRGVFDEILSSRTKRTVTTEYLDADLRQIVAGTNSGSYDQPSYNATAIEVDISRSFFGDVKSEVSTRDSGLLAAKPRKPTPEERRFLVLDMLAIGASQEAEKIAEQTGVNIDAFKALDQVFRNESGASLAAYQRAVLEGFTAVGVTNVEANLFTANPYYFSLGILRAKDAFVPEHLNATMDIFVEELRLSGVPELADQWFEEHRQKIAASAKLSAYVRGMDVLDADDRVLFQTLLEKIGSGQWSSEWEVLTARRLAVGDVDAATAYSMAIFLREAKNTSAEVQQHLRTVILDPRTSSSVRRELIDALPLADVSQQQILLVVYRDFPENRFDAGRAIVRSGMHQDPTIRNRIESVLQKNPDPLLSALMNEPLPSAGECQQLSSKLEERN